jgi:hypothetical protein
MYSFYLLKKLTVKQPEASPSGAIPEESVVIIGGDSSMYVVVPEDFPVGQDVGWKTVILMILTPCEPRLMCLCLHFQQEIEKKIEKSL